MKIPITTVNIRAAYNRKYKGSLFRLIFNSKEAALRKKISDGLSLGDAIEETITECIEKGILADILREHRAKVTDMLFKEYDSAAHIASENEISYEEGFEDGLHQAEQDITKEKERADTLQTQVNTLETEMQILSYFAQGKSPREIAALCEQSIDFVLDVLKKYNL